MIQVWRLLQESNVATAFTGKGAKEAGGRFNSPGVPVVYTSESLALAQLEILVHLRVPERLETYVAFRARIPEGLIDSLDTDDLPSGWRSSPPPRPVQKVGDEWVASENSVALQVPSAVVPPERNILINPDHPDFDQIEVEGPKEPEIDDRLRERLQDL